MSEPAAIAPVPPVDESACASCGLPLAGQHYRAGTQPICPSCTAELHAIQEHNRFTAGSSLIAFIVGIVVALACGAVWAVIIVLARLQLGIAAIGVGIAVAAAIVKVTGKRGRSMQVIAVICSIFGIIAGKGLAAAWLIGNHPDFGLLSPQEKILERIFQFFIAPFKRFGFFDVLWYFLAIRAAWQLAKAPTFNLHGPYPTGAPLPPPGSEGLQFETVEPMNPPSQPPSQGLR
jgi:hypothetical protein